MTLPLEGIHHIHGSDCLPPGVFRVGHTIPNDILKKNLEHTASLLVDQARDALYTPAASKAANGRLRDALDVVPENPKPYFSDFICAQNPMAMSGCHIPDLAKQIC